MVKKMDPKRAWEGLKKRSGGGVVSFDDFMKYWNTSNFSIIPWIREVLMNPGARAQICSMTYPSRSI